MAKTIINLTDPVSTLVTKTNTVSSHLGDISQLNVGASFDSDIVQAINRVNSIASSTDSADIISLVQANSLDSSEALALIASDSGATNIMSQFIKDSANGIGFDSSQGRFFVPSNTITQAMLKPNSVATSNIVALNVGTAQIADDAITAAKIDDAVITSSKFSSAVTLLIKDSAGSTLKTLRSPGS